MRSGSRRLSLLLVVLAGLICLLPSADASAGGRALLSEAALKTTFCAHCPPPPPPPYQFVPPNEGQIEGPCGLAVSSSGTLYVSDYYHREVHRYGTGGTYFSSQKLPGTNPISGVNELDSVCGLAVDSTGRLYGDEFHQGVGLLGGEPIASGETTGVAIDPTDDQLYVDARTAILRFAAGAEPGDAPSEVIELPSSADAYGIAAFEGRIYVADAATNTVLAYDPSLDPEDPVAMISGFNSLFNGALTVDPTNGHLLVLDNLQPGFEHPIGLLEEFSPAGVLLAQLPGAPIDGEPSGLAVDPTSGILFVTDGNSELANVFEYGPYGSSSPLTAPQQETSSGLATAEPFASGTPEGASAAAKPTVSKSARIKRPRHHKRRPAKRHAKGRH